MSVEALAAELRRVVAAFPLALLDQATGLLTDAQAGYAEAAIGTSGHELPDAVQAISEALAAISIVQHIAEAAAQTIERYLAHIGAGGTPSPSAPSATWSPQSATPPPTRPPLSPAARELVDEVRRRGDKISPEKVVRISRDTKDYVVWLEEGDEHAGLSHMLGDQRVAEFHRAGVDKDEIVDLVFDTLRRQKPIGITGRDRPVYETVHHGQPLRIAVTVGGNGSSSEPIPSA